LGDLAQSKELQSARRADRFSIMIYKIRNNSNMSVFQLKAIVSTYSVRSGQRFDILKRLDVDELSRRELETVELGYDYGVMLPKHIYGHFNHFLSACPGPGKSLGGRNLHLHNARVTAGWDVIRFGDYGIFPQLSRENHNVLESYELDNKLVGWTRDRLVVRRDKAKPIRHYSRAVSLFGSYMNQWGHVTFDLLLRLLSLDGYPRDMVILLQEGTPINFVELIRYLWGFSNFEFVPVGSTVTVADLIVPLSRTLCPVGWKFDLDVDKVGWSWTCDGPAWREMKQHADALGTPPALGAERLYLRRRQLNSRFVNADEVDAYLRGHGFKFLHLEEMSIAEVQRALFGAGCIVAGIGSHLSNMLFAPEAARLVIIVPEDCSPFGAINMLAYCGLEVSLVGCRKFVSLGAEAVTPYERKQLPMVTPMPELQRAVEAALAGNT